MADITENPSPLELSLIDYLNQGQTLPFFVNTDWLRELQVFSNSGIIDPASIGGNGPIIMIGDDIFTVEPKPDCGPIDNTQILSTNSSAVTGYSESLIESPAYSILRNIQDITPNWTFGIQPAYRNNIEIGQSIKINNLSYTGYAVGVISNIYYSNVNTGFEDITLNDFYYVEVEISERVGSGSYGSWIFVNLTETQGNSGTTVQGQELTRYENVFRGKVTSLFPPDRFFKFNLDGCIRGGSASNGAGGPWATGGLISPDVNPYNSIGYAGLTVDPGQIYAAPDSNLNSPAALVVNQQAANSLSGVTTPSIAYAVQGIF